MAGAGQIVQGQQGQIEVKTLGLSSCDAEMIAVAGEIQSACCDPPAGCPDEGAPPTECSPSCAEIFLVFYNRCAGFLEESKPAFAAFGSKCQRQQAGLRSAPLPLPPRRRGLLPVPSSADRPLR